MSESTEPPNESAVEDTAPAARPRGWIDRAEEVFFGALLLALLGAGLAPMLDRWFGIGSVAWAGPLAGQLVLWIALFGAGAATRDRQHIKIDVVAAFLPRRGKLALSALTFFIAAAVCITLLPSAVKSVTDEEEGAFVGGGAVLFGISEEWLAGVIPVGLAVLALRLVIAAFVDAGRALGSGERRGEA